MSKHVIGSIEGHNVIYVEEKDIVFCKNTTVPYSILKRVFKNTLTKQQLKEDLYYTTDGFNITLGCLSTNKREYQEFIKNIEKIKTDGKRNK